MIRKIQISDAAQICDIYNYYVLNAITTFVEVPVTLAEMEQKITAITDRFSWYVFEEDNEIKGYAYSNKWNERAAYKNSVETSVYLRNGSEGEGIGSKLYVHLLNDLRNQNYHVAIGGISLPNSASERLHEKFGYTKVAHYKEVGFKFNQWIDVGYWQVILDEK